MHAYNFLSYSALTVLFMFVAVCTYWSSNFYQELIRDQIGSRYATIDGLRGFLALAVFVHHAVISKRYFETGIWKLTEEYPMFHFAADVGVSLFFMITGFLFWNKVITSKGSLNVAKFFESRVNRLFPLYFFHVLIIVFIALAMKNFQLWETPFDLAKNILTWFAFGILGQPDINKAPAAIIEAGVVWTLVYEWAFYVSLPLMACFWKGRRFAILLLVFFAYGIMLPEISRITLFAYGMIAAVLAQSDISRNIFKNNWAALAGCLALVIAFNTDHARQFLYFVFFLIVVSQNSFFGVLTSVPAKLLGTISYSIYLLQGFVLFVVLSGINKFSALAGFGANEFMFITALCGSLLILISTLTYRFIEHPFLNVKQATGA